MKRRFVVKKEGIPDLPGMMLATVDALRSIGGSASIQELDERVAEIERVSEVEQAFLMANNDHRPRLNYYLAWARTYLRRGGAVENSARGVWTLTDRGLAIDSYDQAKEILDRVQLEERERARLKKSTERGLISNTRFSGPLSPSEGDESTFIGWQNKLLEVLKAMPPSGFERLAQRVLRESGFTKVEVRGKSGDGGIDGVGVLRVNLVSFQVFFQCKRWKGSVGAGEIRDFRGAMQGRADKGLFITTGNFTAQAFEEATRDGATAIDLIDGERLCELLKDLGLGVHKELVERITILPAWFEAV